MTKRKISAPAISLHKAIFQLRYKPKLSFHDLLFSAAQKMDEYPDWLTDKLSITLKDHKNRCSLVIRFTNIGYEQDSDDVDLEEAKIKKATEVLPGHLNITSFTRLGFRRRYLISTPMRYDELKEILDLKLVSQDNRFRQILPAKVDDFHFSLDLSDDKSKFHLDIGPIRKEQIPRWIQFNRDNHLSPKTMEEDYRKILKGYPDVSVFIDIDMYRVKEEIPTQEAFSFYQEARQRVERLSTDFFEYLL